MRTKWGIRTLFSVVLLIAYVGGSTSSFSLWAQSGSTGALTGVVTDQSGAVIAGATVTVVNNATGETRSMMTGSNGAYRFGLLLPGSYSVKVSSEGFKTLTVPAVVVNVTETPTQNIQMEVGTTTQEVTVTGEAETLQTQSAALGTVVESRTMTDLPLTTRNYTQVLSLSAGVASNVNNAANVGRGSVDMNVNGNMTVANNYQLDGIDANQPQSNGAGEFNGNQNGGISIPSPDAIAEFKIQTGIYDAGYGRNSGANVNVVTKSGGNAFHGSAFEFVRNDIFNANDFFRNEAGEPRASLKQNQFGGVIGGPIKRDKFFIFGSYEGTRQINGLSSSGLSTVLLPPLTNNRTAATIGAQFCPANHPGNNSFVTFAGGTQVACDGSNINPVALSLLNLTLPNGSYFIPTPQTILQSGPSAGLGFSSYSVPATFREDQAIINMDYVISPKNTLSERYFISRDPTVIPFVPGSGSTVPGTPSDIQYLNNNASLKLTSLMTNNFVNQAQFGWTQIHDESTMPSVPTASSIGQTPTNPFLPIMPRVLINGNLGVFDFGGSQASPNGSAEGNLDGSEQISWIHGKQSIHAGFSYEREFWNTYQLGQSRGVETFQTFNDFLVGESAAQNGSLQGYSNIYSLQVFAGTPYQGCFDIRIRDTNIGSFVQDDVRVSSRLTLNLGLRWDYIGQPWDAGGEFGAYLYNTLAQAPVPPLSGTSIGFTVPSNYNPNSINPLTNQPFGLPAGVLVRPGQGVTLGRAPYDNFDPRIGFAWQPGSKQTHLVVRGGYGWFYNNYPLNANYGSLEVSAPFDDNISLTGVSNAASTLQNPLSVPPTFAFPLRTPTSTRTDGVFSGAWHTGRVQEYSLGMEYEFRPTWLLDIGYLGNQGTHLFESYAVNQPQLASSSNPVNCGYDGVATDCIATNTSKNAALRVPFMGETPSGLTMGVFDGNSWYNSLQVTLKKQFSHGLTFQTAYTYSKAESDFGGGTAASGSNTNRVNNPLDPAAEWGVADFDRTNRLIAYYSWELPGPKGEGFTNTMLKGWAVSGVTTVQSGLPLTLTDPSADGVYGHATTNTITLCPGMTNSSLVMPGSDVARLTDWYNKAAICSAGPVGSDGSTGFGGTGRDIIRGPGQFNWDMSLQKTTKVGGLREDAQLQFRTEFYNLFNHPQFNNPGTALGSSTFGVITSAAVAPRLIQFGLKYIF